MAFTLETYALTQVNDVKSIIDIASGTTTWDQTFIELINGATIYIERYCGGRRFATATYTNETYDCEFEDDDDGRQKWLFLKNWPVTAFTTIEYRSGTTTYASYDSTAYETYTDNGSIYFYGGITKGRKTVRVTYTAGYTINWTTQASHTLPHDITMACRSLVLAAFNKRKSQGIESESVGGASINWGDLLEADPVTKAILDGYRRNFL